MGVVDDIADDLARAVIQAAEDLGDDQLIAAIAQVIGASSTTTQEAFMTSVRVRLSEKRARAALAERIARGPVGGARQGLPTGKVLDAPEGDRQ